MSTRSTLTPLGAVGRGLAAGAFGTLAMDALLFGRYRRGGGTLGFRAWELSSGLSGWEQAPAPAQVGRRLVEGLFQREIPPECAALVNNVTHWVYGLLGSAQYGLVAGSLPRRRIRYGLPFGATVWGAGYVILPAAKLYQPIWEYDRRTLTDDLSAHLVYGLGTAAAFQLLSASTGRRGMTLAPGTIADSMVATLKASGVRRVYGLPGDSLNGFTDALRRDGDLVWEHVRHEESAAFAAAGEAAMTGELAVCAASCGPGNLHLINGLFDANQSRVPVLAIAAHIPRDEIGGSYFQETHPQELFRECSVYSELVSVPDQLPRLLEIAMRHALERSGVAVLVIPGEIFLHRAGRETRVAEIRATSSVVRPADDALAAAAAVLDAAERVTILAGAGCRGAHDQLIALAGTLQAPVVHALRGKELVEYDNPYDVGMTGLLGYASGYRAMEHCDALLMLGTDFPYRPFYPEDARVVQIDVRGEHIGRRFTVEVGLVGTVRDTADVLLPHLRTGRDTAHLDRMTSHYRRTRARLDALAKPRGDGGPIHPQVAARALDRLADDDAVFLADVGTPTLWAARYLRMNGRRRLIGSFNHGTMANAMPQAIGVQASHPGRQVVTLSGDGGLAMMMGELLTLRQLRLPVKVVVLNNGALSFVELEMKANGIVNFGTDLENPSFAEVARAIGLHGVRIEHPSGLDQGLRSAFAYDGPAVVEVMTTRQELAIPPRISAAQAKGFTLWATRSVLSGRGDEVLEVARSNVRQLSVE